MLPDIGYWFCWYQPGWYPWKPWCMKLSGEPIARHVTCSDAKRQLLGGTHLG